MYLFKIEAVEFNTSLQLFHSIINSPFSAWDIEQVMTWPYPILVDIFFTQAISDFKKRSIFSEECSWWESKHTGISPCNKRPKWQPWWCFVYNDREWRVPFYFLTFCQPDLVLFFSKRLSSMLMRLKSFCGIAVWTFVINMHPFKLTKLCFWSSKKNKIQSSKRSKMLAKGVFLPYLRMGKICTPTWLLCSSSGDRKSSSLHPGDQGSPHAKLYLESSVWSPLPSRHFCCWSPDVPVVHLSPSGLARVAACPHPLSPGAIWLESGVTNWI